MESIANALIEGIMYLAVWVLAASPFIFVGAVIWGLVKGVRKAMREKAEKDAKTNQERAAQ